MPFSSSLYRKLALLLRRNRFRSELDEEMAFHRAEHERTLRADGTSLQQARKTAAREFGNAAQLKEQSTEAVSFRFESVAQDLRFALRQLRKHPSFAITATLILALGIGASVAIFGFVDAALIKPLPYQEPSRLTMLYESNSLGPRFHLSYPDYLDWKQRTKSFSSLDIFEADSFLQKTSEGVQHADGASVSAGFFHTLGVVPALGRDFYPGEDSSHAPGAVLLSYAAWQKRYGGRASALGQTVTLDGQTNTIVGVLPASFHFAPTEPADFWRLLVPAKWYTERGSHELYGIARLKDGVSFEAALADVRSTAEQLERQYPDTNRNRGGVSEPLTEEIIGDMRPVLLVLLGGAALLLLIAIVNVSSLLLVRSESRRREIAVRGALGASAQRLLRQFITEGLLLASAGSLIGIASGVETMRLLTTLVPADVFAKMPYLLGLGLNLHLALFSVAICLLIGLLFALTPTLRLSLHDIHQGLNEGARGAAGTLWRRFGANLVVIEIAIATILLVGAGLLGKSLYRLLHTDAGMQSSHLATLTVNATGERYAKDEQVVALEKLILARVLSLPGVESAGLVNHLPLGDGDGTRSLRVLDLPATSSSSSSLDQLHEAADRDVSAGYLKTIGARIRRGRGFRDDEDASKPLVAIVNQTVVRQFFGNADPLGKRIIVGDPSHPIEVVGVVDDIQEGQLDAAARGAVYLPFDQDTSSNFSIVVRTAQEEASILPALTIAIHQIDPQLALFAPSTISQRIHDSPSAYLHRTSASIVGWFASTALLLSVVGLYGVMAYTVSQRTREIGVRMALGAPRGSVYALVLKEAGWLTGVGIALGLIASLGSATLMRKLLFGTQAWDATTLAGVALTLAGASMLASYLPARRAASVNPVEALRAE